MAAPAPVDIAVATLVAVELVDARPLLARPDEPGEGGPARVLDRELHSLLARWGGYELSHAGGYLLQFPRACDALCFAEGVHEALEALSLELGEALLARVGVQVRAAGVDAARALMRRAVGGQTLAAEAVVHLAEEDLRRAQGHEEHVWYRYGALPVGGAPVVVWEVGRAGRTPLVSPLVDEPAVDLVRWVLVGGGAVALCGAGLAWWFLGR